ncbi:MAG TPA: transcription antitermination factor NusB, partial [Longimicrobiales bacterium]|nr:transcription antitermination factor NusB [Longimicrobiales bacterium]
MTAARAAALRVLEAAGRGRRLDLALAEERPGLPDRDRPWVHELVYGTVRLRGRLDHLLDHHLHRGLASLDPVLLDVLRLGAYQLLHMGSVPPWAAVSQAVEQARGRRRDGGAGGMVNAVLRAVARTGEDPDLFPSFGRDPAGHLSTWGSHPRWMVERWLARWPADRVRALVEADNRVPPLTLVPLDGDVGAALARLSDAGIEAAAVGRGTSAVELPSGTEPEVALAALPGAVFQDPGASLVVPYADPPRDGTVADLCAAPGGKALVLAGRGAYVCAADRSPARLAMLRENAVRADVGVGAVVALAERPAIRPVPLVLVDAPCTGTGTLRRHPDARWRLDPGDLDRMAVVQQGILEGAARAVAPGGLLVYATCSLEAEENEDR